MDFYFFYNRNSWSSHKFDYQGICDLVLLHSSDYANGRGLDIHIRTAEKEGTSYISTAVVKIGPDKLEIHEDGKYYWNDEINIPLPDMIGDSTISYVVMDGWLPMWTITSPRGGTIIIQIFNVMVDVKLSGFLNETISESIGLMGDVSSGFLVDRKGEWMFDMDKFGNEWQVRDTEPMLFHEVRHPQYPYICGLPLVDAVDRRMNTLEAVPIEEARELCTETGTYYDNCVQDLRLTGNRETGKYYQFLAKISM
jgi:hypothetical protein